MLKGMRDVKVFDFDNTLYHGESSVDLALYMIKNNKRIILYLPKLFYNLFKYKLCIVDRNKMIRGINDFLQNVLSGKDELLGAVDGFWAKNRRKLDAAMLKRIDSNDVIITAGPDFLLNGIRDMLNTENILCSSVDTEKMQVRYLNFGSSKARLYKKKYGSRRIDCFYTDSYNDKSLMELSERVFIVKKGRLKRVK